MACGKPCRQVIQVRPTCGGGMLCIAPWLAVLLTAIFLLTLLCRCSGSRQSCDAPASAVTEAGESAITVLMYHHLLPKAQVGALAGNSIVTYVEDFEAQLQWITENGWECITSEELLRFYEEGAALPEKAVLLTFDDGYLSNAAYAAPLLRQYGCRATVFLVTGAVGEGEQQFSADAVQMMTRDTLEQNADVLEYAAHTHDLHHADGHGHSLLTLGTAAQIADDLAACKALLQTLPNSCPAVFSYPYGFVTESVKATLRENGVRLAFRADSGRPTRATDPLEIPRYPVDSGVSMATFIGYFE